LNLAEERDIVAQTKYGKDYNRLCSARKYIVNDYIAREHMKKWKK